MTPGVVVQARMGSSRLRGKVMADIAGAPMLQHVLERAARAHVGPVVLATTLLPEDDELETLAVRCGVAVQRGSVDDVLSRYIGAARRFDLDPVVRITSDCPLIDPALIDATLEAYVSRRAAYATLGQAGGLPLGLSVEVIARAALEATAAEADPGPGPAREHVTLWASERPQRFARIVVQAPEALRRPHYRLTVDESADLELIRTIHARLGCAAGTARLADVIALLDRDPALAAINGSVRQHRPTTLSP